MNKIGENWNFHIVSIDTKSAPAASGAVLSNDLSPSLFYYGNHYRYIH